MPPAAGEPCLPWPGAKLAIKDNPCTKGIRTIPAPPHAGDFVPPYESTVTETPLAIAGAVLLGKTKPRRVSPNGQTRTEDLRLWAPARNPMGPPSRVPGGSSGAVAAAGAAREAMASPGLPIRGGSIRQPAYLLRRGRLKPTYGRLSRWGLVAFASFARIRWALQPVPMHGSPCSSECRRRIPR